MIYYKSTICQKQILMSKNITRPNCALDKRKILCLYVPGFQRQVFKHVKNLSERSKESKEQKKNKGSVLVAKSAYNAQNAQFGLVMKFEIFCCSDVFSFHSEIEYI